MQTQLCGSIPCFGPEPSVETATPQLKCGAAADNDERSDTDDGLTPEDLMEVLSLYLL